jgi:hypothetical protein
MHSTCSNDIAPMAPAACAQPSPLIQLGTEVDTYLQELMASITPDMLEENGRLRLVVANEMLAGVVRGLLEVRGHTHVDVEVAAPVVAPAPVYAPERWTPEMAAAKEAYGRQLHRHHRGPATTPATTKARKAARKRAKAGRKASR